MSDTTQIHLKSGRDHPYDYRGEGRKPKPKDWAEAAARGVLSNLCDRRGIKWALQDPEIDVETRREIVQSLAEIIRAAAEKEAA